MKTLFLSVCCIIIALNASAQTSAIHVQPISSQPCEGTAAIFMASDTSVAATVQWQVSTDSGLVYSSITGANDTIYTFLASPAQSGYLYRAVFFHSGQYDIQMQPCL